MLQTLQVKLEPSVEDKAKLDRTILQFNLACDHIAGVAFRERRANKVAIQKLVYRDVRDRFGLSAQLTVRAIAKTCEAYKRDKTIRCKFRADGAVAYDQRILSWKGWLDSASMLTVDGRIRVPTRLGAYQRGVLKDRPVRGAADLVRRKGEYYLFVVVDAPEATPFQPKEILGVDLGVVNIATDSEGTIHKADRVDAVRERTDRIRATLQAVGTKSARRHLRKIGRYEARFRRNENHVISKSIIAKAKDTGCAIALEDLEGINARTTVQKAERRRRLSWAFWQLRAFIDYKARIAGVPTVIVDPRNTSRTCPSCGHCEKANRRGEAFRCRGCTYENHADVVGALNIAKRAGVMRPIASEAFDGRVSSPLGASPAL